MGMMTRIRAALGFERRAAPDPSWQAIAPGIGYLAGVSARQAENLSTVQACVSVIATALAATTPLVYRRDGQGNRAEVFDHPLNLLTRAGASGNMSWPDFIEHLVASALLTGNGLAEIGRDEGGRLTGLHYIPWGMVTVARLPSGRLAYDVSDGQGHSKRLLQDEVLHLRDRTDDGLVGRSRLSRGAAVIEAALSANEYSRAFMSNGAAPSGVLRTKDSLTAEQRKVAEAALETKFAGAMNSGRPMLLDRDMEWQGISISPEDAELLESRKFGVEEVCRLYQVPPPLVQDYSHNTFTNSETAGRWFAMFTLAPWARKIEAEFARSVFPTGGPYELELDLSAFLRGDPATRWAAHEIALRNGVLDPDEVRQVEGWNRRQSA